MDVIGKFEKEYEFLSNFYTSPFSVNIQHLKFNIFPDMTIVNFKTVEHFYQAFKAANSNEFTKVILANTPSKAKQLGRRVQLRKDFDKIKLRVMYIGCFLKFEENPILKQKLVSTGTAKLVEGNWWHDNYWGDCYCSKCQNTVGQNQLGQALMTIRDLYIKGEF